MSFGTCKKYGIVGILALLASVVPSITAGAQNKHVYQTQPFDKDIRTIQIFNNSRQPLLPVIELDGSDKVSLSFDDLSETLHTYAYKIVHCNWDWTQSDLSESQYLSGYTGSNLEHQSSVGTYFPYNHFTLDFPNDEATCVVSGNYAIIIYRDNDYEHPVLSACFSVVESLVQIDCSVSASTDIDYQKEHQQVALDINFPNFSISQPQNSLKVIVQQNRRRDNQAVLTAPSFYQNSSVNYKLNPALIFPAGNQYWSFDISSDRMLDRTVESIDYYKPYFHATLFTNQPRKNRHMYDYSKDLNGRYIINLQGSDYSDTDADYFFTHFFLEMEPLLGEDVYILGDLTGNRLDSGSRMKYNYSTGRYEKVLLLKQGGYNFVYASVMNGDDRAYVGKIDGNYWQTTNEYTVYVYYRPFGSLYDRLIGYNVSYAGNNY